MLVVLMVVNVSILRPATRSCSRSRSCRHRRLRRRGRADGLRQRLPGRQHLVQAVLFLALPDADPHGRDFRGAVQLRLRGDDPALGQSADAAAVRAPATRCLYGQVPGGWDVVYLVVETLVALAVGACVQAWTTDGRAVETDDQWQEWARGPAHIH
jgi:hypothetical protein